MLPALSEATVVSFSQHLCCFVVRITVLCFPGCVPCLKPGHVCDQVSGACVCPQNTLGEQCGRCVENTWDYNKDRGCKVAVLTVFL